MSNRFFLPRDVTHLQGASGQRGGMLRPDRDGRLSLVGSVRPMRQPLPFRERLAIGFVLILAVALVALSRSYGEPVRDVEQVEEDDAPRGDR